MLDCTVLHFQIVCELIHVAWSVANRANYPNAVFTTPLSAEQEPKGATERGIFLHLRPDERQSLIY